MNDSVNSTKVCSKCQVEKPLSEFYKCKVYKDGLDYICKFCSKKYKQEHKSEVSLQRKQYRLKHREELLLGKKAWDLKNKEKNKEKSQQYYSENTDKLRQYARQYYQEHSQERIFYGKQYAKENKYKINHYIKNRRKNDIRFKMICICRGAVHHALKTTFKTERTMKYFMCSVDEFKKHIEQQWVPGMTWDNRGNGIGKWNIDHIIPISFFDMTDEVEKYMCCRYQNLQPLWWKDNSYKSNKLNHFHTINNGWRKLQANNDHCRIP